MADNNQILWNTTGEDLVKLYKTDLTGKIAIVTGPNSGIGLETARVLASVGAKVIIPCRTFEKAEDAIKTIKKSVPNADLVPMKLELSDLSSISEFSNSFYQLNLPLHLLVNNAGIMGCPKSFTEDGFETQFGVNHLGHFYLTQSLLGKLQAEASTGARVVCVSSAANYHFLGKEGLDFDNLNAEKSYSPSVAYGQAKFANILFAKELQRRFDAEGVDITVTSLHPGAVVSNLGRHINLSAAWDSFRHARDFFSLVKEVVSYKNVKIGASTSIYCCVSPDVKKGEFYADNVINRTVLNEQADNKEMAKRLWDLSEKLIAKALNPSMSLS
ncbi:Histone deacetylase complex subunit [Mucor velutinosus]|uniref:Histone deacetylase complex subunit n=1 Tax=Mucor velutinosus TaxID=708070 RepID=A0AAN7DGV7_9FUNG|nr:Histone deacetylase complex subunit [Mucor velutinosus]